MFSSGPKDAAYVYPSTMVLTLVAQVFACADLAPGCRHRVSQSVFAG